MRELSDKGERKVSGSHSETGTKLKNDMAGGGAGSGPPLSAPVVSVNVWL